MTCDRTSFLAYGHLLDESHHGGLLGQSRMSSLTGEELRRCLTIVDMIF